VGEMALFTNEPRSATVVARLDSELVRFPQSTFIVLAITHPLVMLDIARSVIMRASGRSAAAQRECDYPVIAVLSLSPGGDSVQIGKTLAKELATFGRTCCVGREFLGVPEELEEQFDIVVYVAGPQADKWTRACFLRADLVLLAADVMSLPSPG